MRECSRRGIWRVVAMLLAVLLLVESLPLNVLAAPLRRYGTAGNNSYIPLISSDVDEDEYDEEDRDGDVIDDREFGALGLYGLSGGRLEQCINEQCASHDLSSCDAGNRRQCLPQRCVVRTDGRRCLDRGE